MQTVIVKHDDDKIIVETGLSKHENESSVTMVIYFHETVVVVVVNEKLLHVAISILR